MPLSDLSLENLPDDELERHAAWLRRLALGLVGDASAAEDVAQGTWQRLADGRATGARSLRPFLAGVARRLAWRRRVGDARRVRRERAGARPEALPSASELAARLELAERLAREVAALADHERTVVLLRYYDGLSAAEIARHQGVPAATVRARLKRGLDHLRERLAREGEQREHWGVVLAHWAAHDAASFIPVGTATGAMAMAGVAKITTVTVGAVIVVAGGVWWLRAPAQDPLHPQRGALAPDEREVQLEELASAAAPQNGGAREVVEPGSGKVAAVPASTLRAPLRGRLLDDAGDALPYYTVLVRGSEGQLVLVESDELGGLETEESFVAGALLLRGIDHSRLVHDRDQDLDYFHRPDLESTPEARGVEPEWTFRVGPTYTLDTALPAGLATEDFKVELIPLGRSLVIGAGLAPLRFGARPWVRFSANVPHMNGKGPWALRVRSADGFWAGQAIVETRVGVHHEPVALEITARGRLEGTCRQAEGPLLGQFFLQLPLRRVDGAVDEAADWGPIFVRDDGHLEGQHLPPGEYELSFRTPRHRRQTQRVLIEAGSTTTVELVVELRDDLASISGVIEGTSGPLNFDGARLMIRHSAVFANYFVTPVETAGEGDVERGTFHFEAVPLGEYTLWMQDLDKFALEPPEVTVNAGDSEVHLRCQAVSQERAHYVLTVHAWGSGDPVRYPRFGIRLDGSDTWMLNGDADGLVNFSSAVAQPFEWMVGADGFAPRWGSEREFADTESVSVTLEPGWGTEFHVYAGLQPVEGVELLLDGVSMGVTDAGGHLRVALDEKPERCSIASDVWVIAGGQVDIETGEFVSGLFGTGITLERRE